MNTRKESENETLRGTEKKNWEKIFFKMGWEVKEEESEENRERGSREKKWAIVRREKKRQMGIEMIKKGNHWKEERKGENSKRGRREKVRGTMRGKEVLNNEKNTKE